MTAHRLHHALESRTFVKVIAGIDNFDVESVLSVARAATEGGAHAVDIACAPSLIRAVKAESSLCVFVSSVDPDALAAAADAGADVLELGNFDALYRAGIEPTAAQILDWTRAVKVAVGDRLPLCVTTSGRLSLAEQLDLATSLQAAGADLIQSEGVVGPHAPTDTFGAIAAITAALANAAELRKVVELPIFVAGSVTPTNAAFAIAAGACGVGIGRAVREAGTHAAMTRVVSDTVDALARLRVAGPGLATRR